MDIRLIALHLGRLVKIPQEGLPVNSRVFQTDLTDGNCVQIQLPAGTNTISWDFLNFCLLVVLLLAVFCFRQWCCGRRRHQAGTLELNSRHSQVYVEEWGENFI